MGVTFAEDALGGGGLIKNISLKLSRLNENIRSKVLRWLGIESIFNRLTRSEKANKQIIDKIREVEDSAILGVDLGYRDISQIIIIKYSKLNNAFKVIADTESRFPDYNNFVRNVRALCTKHNVEVMALDSFPSGPDLRVRILPDKGITDRMRDYSEL